MEDNSFTSRRRKIMVENGEDVSIFENERQQAHPTSASEYTEAILTIVDQIIPKPHHIRNTNDAYNVQLRSHAEKLHKEGKEDDEILESVCRHISLHPVLITEFHKLDAHWIDTFVKEPIPEFDQ